MEYWLRIAQKAGGDSVKYNPNDMKLASASHMYGSAVGAAMKTPDVKAGEESWNDLPIDARAASPFTEAEAKARLAQGKDIF
jgi:hypothetical protein